MNIIPSFVMAMLNKILQSLGDPRKPLLGPSYWMLKKMGMILPKNRFATFLYIVIHEIATFFVVSQYIELFFIGSDLNQIITNIKISMLSFVCVVKAHTMVMWQKEWLDVLEYVTTTDKEEREDRDNNATRSGIINGYTTYGRRITYLYCVLVLVTVVTVTQTPLMLFLSSTSFRDNIINETEPFPHIFSSWVPFDKYHSPGCWFTVSWHVYMCAYGASVMAAYDITAIVIMVFLGGKLDLLSNRCKLMLGTSQRGIKDDEAQLMYAKVHRSLVLLFGYCKRFNSLLSPVMFVYMVMCSLMLCASAYQLTSANDAAQKVLTAEYLFFGISQLFMFCWHSNIVLYKSQQLSFGAYESEWWVANVRQRKNMIILLGQMKKEIYFTAGPFTNLTLPTFINILKGSYSYYTLLRK